MARIVVALYERIEDVRAAVEEFSQNGFERTSISVIAKETAGEAAHTQARERAKGLRAAGPGSVLGGLGGMRLGDVSMMSIPGMGPLMVSGPIAAILVDTSTGMAAAGLESTLQQIGIPEEEAGMYAADVQRGHLLMIVNTEDRLSNRAIEIMSHHNPVDMERQTVDTEMKRYEVEEDEIREAELDETEMTLDEQDRTTIPVIEEELRVGKGEVETGGFTARTFVQQEPAQKTVTVRDEHVSVERQPVDRPISEQDLQAFQEVTFEVDETREEVVAEKRARVLEEVEIRKETEERQETIQDTVRCTEEVERIEPEQMAGTMGTTGLIDVGVHEEYFRNHFRTMYSGVPYTYDQVRPYYLYGHELANSERFRDRTWQDIEPEARREFERRYPNARWNDFKSAIQAGWERTKASR